MSVSVASIFQLLIPKASYVHQHVTTNKPVWRRKQTFGVIRCCNREAGERTKKEKSYYEVLGVSADSTPREIKEAYRKLQKKHHPDIAGQKGHEYTLKLNEAYKVLMRKDLKKKYDSSISQMSTSFIRDITDLSYSTWKGPLRPQALFVDENACIGCRECVHHASNTFVMDEARGCARVRVQYGDDDQRIAVSVDSCPVNCIYWVDSEQLPVLEFLNQPRQKEGHGVFGGGWERPKNIFEAAKFFNKQLKQQSDDEYQQRNMHVNVKEETPAQAEARANASNKIKMERVSKFWNWAKEAFKME